MKKILLFFISTLFLGCSSINNPVVAVDSYSATTISGGTYYLTTNTTGMELQQQAFEVNIQNMLSKKGYIRTFIPNNATFKIVYNYEVRGPFTSYESYPAPISPWWNGPYGGLNNGFYGDMWTNSVITSTYFVKRLELSAYNRKNTPIWQVVGSLKSDNYEMRESFPILVSGISNYINVNSGEVVYVTVNPEPSPKKTPVHVGVGVGLSL